MKYVKLLQNTVLVDIFILTATFLGRFSTVTEVI